MSPKPHIFVRIALSVILTAFAGVTCAAFALMPTAVSPLLWVGLAFLVAWAAIAIVSLWRWSPRINLVQRIWAGAFLAYLLVALVDTFVRTSDGESSGMFVDRVRAVAFVGLIGIPLLVFAIRGRVVDLLLARLPQSGSRSPGAEGDRQ